MEETTPLKIKPDCHSERCPVCNGFGTLSFGKKVCHVCKGRCYLLVPNKLLDRLIGEEEDANHKR